MKNKLLKRVLVLIALIVSIFAIWSYFYINDYYRASEYVDDIIKASKLKVETIDNLTIISNDEAKEKIGIIFYPGGKVESKAYMPLLLKISELGYTCVLVDMPGKLAIFNIDGAEDVFDLDLNIDKWYLMGHSLGGAMASSYSEKNYDKFEGLILLGAYPVNEAPLESLVIFGSHDIMLDLEKANSADKVFEIIGGNHAYFGDYGEQEGDGSSEISREDQQEQAVNKIHEFIGD